MTERMTYASVGVDYEAMDVFKRAAQLAGRETSRNLSRFGYSEVEWSRGESVYLIETPDSYSAHVIEGLGTKNLVADAMSPLAGKSYYDQIGQCLVATIVNDMVPLGALPLSLQMHLAVGNSDWFKDEERYQDLIDGCKNACDLAGCTYSGGETATLKDILLPGTGELSGSAFGEIKPKERLINSAKIREGDAVVLIGSSGIHANGLTLAREIAGKLPKGYLTELEDGLSFGEALLAPTIIYVPLIEDCLKAEVPIHYAVNITGHGWRKLMRATQPFDYIIDRTPEPQPVFRFLQEHGLVDDEEAYGNLNMGAGFALYVPENEVERITAMAESLKMTVLHAGYIERSRGEKRVLIKPKGLEYLGSTLGVR